MAFSDLQQKAISEYAVQAAHKNLAKLNLFAHTFTELDGRYGESIAVPVYDLSASADFVAGTNDYGSGVNEVGGVVVSLDKHLVKSVSITDKELAYTGINWAKDTGVALADRLTRDVNSYVFSLINSTNCPLSTSFDATSKSVIANLYAIAQDNDIPVDKAVVALNTTQFAKVLQTVDYSMVGSGDYIKTAMIEGLVGFKGFVCVNNLPESANGAIILDEAIGIASKYLAPMTEGAYPEAWSISDENGFTLGARRFMDLNKGADIFAMDALFGAKLLQPKKVVRLV